MHQLYFTVNPRRVLRQGNRSNGVSLDNSPSDCSPRSSFAEVAVPRALFVAVLPRIDRPRGLPVPAM
jgi:hypothetical protein